jgi:hypothetical protein
MIDATGLGVDLRWEYPWRFGAKAGALYLASFGVSAAFPPFELPPDTNCQKEIPSTPELIDMTGTSSEQQDVRRKIGDFLIPLSPWRVIGLGRGVIEFEMIVEMAAGTTRQAGEGDGRGEGLSGANCKSWTIWCNAIHAEDRHRRQSRARAAARG